MLFALAMMLASATTSIAQSYAEQMVPVAVCVPNVGKYASVRSILENKLNIVATEQGMTGSNYSPRFVMYPVISVLDTRRTTNPPVLTLVELQVNVYIADYIDDNRFASTSFILKGGGQSEEKAYMDAVKKINNNAELQRFVSEAKSRILNYYNGMCDKMLLEANTMSQNHNYDKAMQILGSIPQASTCFENGQELLQSVYRQYYKHDCASLLQSAKACVASRNMHDALLYISDIYPDCDCYEEARIVYNDVVKYINNQEQQAYHDKKQQRELQYEKEQRELEREHELQLLGLAVELSQYQSDRQIQNLKDERAFQIARISAMNSFNISDGTVIQDYVNSLINPYW